MENGGNKGQENDHAWDIWELNTSRFDLVNGCGGSNTNTFLTTNTTTSLVENSSSSHHNPEACSSSANGPFLFPYQNGWFYHHHHHNNNNQDSNSYQQLALYAGDGSNLHPDPHLMCLKLGKRHYFEDCSSSHHNNNNNINNPVSDRHVVDGFSIGKRGKTYYTVGGGGHDGPGPSSSSSSSSLNVPRCQVEGCHVVLVNAKDYHRRHKVCEMHSKSPKVIVLGLEQRFCQQCSRFHVVTEFDDAKRSCRRRLAGHNERRRKSSQDSVSRNSSQDKLIGRFPYIMSPMTGCALSLLSSKSDSWVSPSDLSSRSSAALRELIVEHRAAILARQLILEKHLHNHVMEDLGESQPSSDSLMPHHQHQMLSEPPHNWTTRFHDAGTHVTLDLMQAPSSAFGFLSTRGKTKEEEDQECSELWNTLEGAHVVQNL